MEEWVPLSEMEFSELNVPTGESESNLEPSEDHTELSDSSDVNEVSNTFTSEVADQTEVHKTAETNTDFEHKNQEHTSETTMQQNVD